nr:MAG TPA: hypothetical protein [Caudoviricetes sp.]
MKFKKVCTKVEFLEAQGDGVYNENVVYFAGRVPKSKVQCTGVIQSVSYPKCDVEIPDAILNQYANITEIEQ